MMSNPIEVTFSAEETEAVLRLITGTATKDNWEDAIYNWWPRADPHIRKLADYRAAHGGKRATTCEVSGGAAPPPSCA